MEFDLQFWGNVSFVFAIILVIEVLGHLHFYLRLWLDKELDKSARQHSLRIAIVVVGILFGTVSIGLYGLNWVAFKGEDDWRMALKAVQLVSMLTLWGGLRYLRSFSKGL